MQNNKMTLRFLARSQNEAFARVTISAFASQLAPTVGELADIKTAVSEAVTNSIIHGYGEKQGEVEMSAVLEKDTISIEVRDYGRGIADVEQAREPFFTTGPKDERSGMGFTVMETFMDSVEIESKPGEGTTVVMKKRMGSDTNE